MLQEPKHEPLEPSSLPNPWDLDAATRPRRPAWGFPEIGHIPTEACEAGASSTGAYGAGLLDYEPNYSLVDRRVLGVADFAKLLRR